MNSLLFSMGCDTMCPKLVTDLLSIRSCISQATLPLGGIRPEDARKSLEQERNKDESDFPSTFALELAYIVERYGEETESEADEVLDLVSAGSVIRTLCLFLQLTRLPSLQLPVPKRRQVVGIGCLFCSEDPLTFESSMDNSD